MLNTVRDIVGMLPTEYRLRLQKMIALPLIHIGSSMLVSGKLVYEPISTEETRVVGFRPDRFSEDG